jgi:hypothetical protein
MFALSPPLCRSGFSRDAMVADATPGCVGVLAENFPLLVAPRRESAPAWRVTSFAGAKEVTKKTPNASHLTETDRTRTVGRYVRIRFGTTTPRATFSRRLLQTRRNATGVRTRKRNSGGEQRLQVKRRENVARGPVAASRTTVATPIQVRYASVKWLVFRCFFGDFLAPARKLPAMPGRIPGAVPRAAETLQQRKEGFDRLSLNGQRRHALASTGSARTGGRGTRGFDRLSPNGVGWLSPNGWERHAGAPSRHNQGTPAC